MRVWIFIKHFIFQKPIKDIILKNLLVLTLFRNGLFMIAKIICKVIYGCHSLDAINFAIIIPLWHFEWSSGETPKIKLFLSLFFGERFGWGKFNSGGWEGGFKRCPVGYCLLCIFYFGIKIYHSQDDISYKIM